MEMDHPYENGIESSEEMNSSRESWMSLFDEEELINIETDESVICYSIGRPLKQTFEKLVELYPLGISIEKYMELFIKSEKYEPNHFNFGFCSFQEMVQSGLQDVFWTVESPLGEVLLFPRRFKTLVPNSRDLFMKIWTRIEYLLTRCRSILKLNEIPSLLKEMSGIIVDPLDWCTSSEQVDAYYDYCIKETSSPSTPRIFLFPMDPESSSPRLLVQVNPLNPETIRLKNQMEYEEIKAAFEIQMDSGLFVRLGDKIDYLIDIISTDSVYKCHVRSIHSPGHFYVNLHPYHDELESLQKAMQVKYGEQELSSNHSLIPLKEHLHIGLHVAVRRPSDGEWHRAKILNELNDNIYLVFLIDDGDFIDLEIAEIRHLFQEFFTKVKAQAVLCVGQLGPEYNLILSGGNKIGFNHGIGYSASETNIFRDLVHNEDLAVHFKNRTVVNGNKGWEVWVHILNQESHIKIYHVEREVMKISQGRYLMSDNEEIEKRTNLFESVLGESTPHLIFHKKRAP